MDSSSPAGEGRVGSRAVALVRSDTGRAAAMAAAVMVANVVSLVFVVVFARLLGASGYAALAALVSAFLILSVPGQALQATVARDVSHAAAEGDERPAAGVWRWLRGLAVVAVPITVASVLGRDLLAATIGVPEHEWAAAATLPAGCAWLMLSVARGALQGLRRYGLVAASVIGEAIARLATGIALFELGGGVTGAFLGTFASVAVTAAVLLVPLERAPGAHGGARPGEGLRRLVGGAWAPIVSLALVALLQHVDVIVVKHLFDDDEAGSYAADAVAAKGIIWIAVGLGLYLLPEAARRTRAGLDARPVLVRTLAIIALAAVPMVLLYTVAGEPVIRIAFGADLTGAVEALPWLGIAMTLMSCTYLAVQYLLAIASARFIVALVAAALAEPLVLMAIGADLTQIAIGLAGIQAALALVVGGLALSTAHHPERVAARRAPSAVR
jgi:O-antigen/teichoic acid export membrane protein